MKVELDQERGIAVVQPTGSLTEDDFELANALINPYIEKRGSLNGLVIFSPSFPGWDSFGSLVSHFRFVKDHQKNIERIALVTDSLAGQFGERLVNHFVNAEVKKFPADRLEQGKNWTQGTYDETPC